MRTPAHGAGCSARAISPPWCPQRRCGRSSLQSRWRVLGAGHCSSLPRLFEDRGFLWVQFDAAHFGCCAMVLFGGSGLFLPNRLTGLVEEEASPAAGPLGRPLHPRHPQSCELTRFWVLGAHLPSVH